MTRVIVKDFWSKNFEICNTQIELIKDLESTYRGRVEFQHLSANENESLVEKYRIKDYPTIIIECDGMEKERFVGLTQQLFLKRAIDRILSECR